MMIVEMIKKQRLAQIAMVMFVFFVTLWILLYFTVAKDNIGNQIFSATYGLMALYGAILGFKISKKWGLTKSLMGKSILMFSLGLLAQEFGQLTYSYYAYFAKIQIPYPSLGDVGYFGCIPLYILGIFYLGKAAGVNISLRSFQRKIEAVIIPFIILSYSYFVFLQGYQIDWSKPLTVFLDFGYPLGQAIYISIAILTILVTRGILGGIMKYKVLFIFFALLVQYFADYMYLYIAKAGTAYPGGPNDVIYLVAYFLMVLALLQLRVSAIKSKLT